MTKWDKFVVTWKEGDPPSAWICRFEGTLTNCPEAYAFLDELRDRMHARPGPVIADLGGVDRITSGGVGILAASHTSATNAGGRLILTSLHPRVEMVLNVVRILTVLEHQPTEADALRALKG